MKRINYILSITCLTLLSLSCDIVCANPKGLQVDAFSIETGLSQTNVTCIFQDSRGIIWIGTQDGLNLFTSHQFKIYRHQPFDTNSISNNYIRAITEDKEGNIWIGTNNGLNKLDLSTETFTSYYANPSKSNTIIDNLVYYVYCDSEGTLWIKTLEYLTKYDPETEKFYHYAHFNNVFNFVSGQNDFCIIEDNEGKLWVGTKDGLNYFDKDLEIFERFAVRDKNQKSISNNKIKAIHEDNEGNLWIGTENGLNLFDKKTKNFKNFFHNPRDPYSLSDNTINTIYQDYTGCLWIGTNNGVNKYNTKTRKFERITKFYYSNEIVKNLSVSAIIQDKSKVLWIGTFRGLFKHDLKPKKFILYNNSSASIPQLSSNYITAIFSDNKYIWLGTWGMGLNIVNRETNRVIKYFQTPVNPNNKISNNFIHSIYKDSKGNIFLGTRNGINVYNSSTRTFDQFCLKFPNVSCNLFRNNIVYSIFEDKKGNYWFATSHGLHKFDVSYNFIKSIYQIQSDTTEINFTNIFCIMQDMEDMIWFGSDKGLTKYDPTNELFYHYKTIIAPSSNSLSSDIVYSILQDSRGEIWIGTAAGLNKYNKSDDTFIVYSEKDGLPNNLIYNILEGSNHTLWMSTNKGIVEFNPLTDEFISYDMADGLQNYEFNHGAAFKSQTGELFFGGISGFNSFFPDSLQVNIFKPPIIITSLTLITSDGERSLPVIGKKQIVIPPKTNMFNIEFASLDYTYPKKNHYAYKLLKTGEDGQWIHINSRNHATFSNLPPGEYTFHVKGSNSDLIWNEEGTALVIIVQAPFYKTRTAYIIYGVVIFVVIYLLVQLRTKSLRVTNKILKEKELAAKEIARQKEELSFKNKNITDSINYAKRIQEAMMPSKKMFEKLLPHSFILHKPKDIVSGDFYWIDEYKNKVFVAAADCTGHGVPGAFMSIIGFELFRRITSVQSIFEPAEILNNLNKDFRKIFKDVDNISLKDGMDIAICVFDKTKNYLEFAGAFNPLYIIRNNKIIEIKGDRVSVGLEDEEDNRDIEFTNHTIPLEHDDMIYIFSDGYADQFGGPEGKKYKYRRFRHLLLTVHKMSLNDQLYYLDYSIENWMGELDQIDDILVIGIKPDFIYKK